LRYRWVVLLLLFLASAGLAAGKSVNLAMCRPTVYQIKNIEALRANKLLPGGLRLICVHHENEETDYAPSREYVKANALDWIAFRPVTGRVPEDALFRENAWTPQFRAIFEGTDGIIFTGGMDIPPRVYGEPEHLLTEATTPMRSLYEISFLFHLVGGGRNSAFVPFLEGRKEYPLLGICLGLQSLNVAAGGTLVQDIPSEIYGLRTIEQVLAQKPETIHSGAYRERQNRGVEDLAPHFHPIRLEADSSFVREMGVRADARPLVVSTHHQAIGKTGRDLVAAAWSLDGKVIEAMRHRRYPHVLGVHFHPEDHTLYTQEILFRSDPKAQATLSLKAFLESDGVSLPFHLRLWRWFSDALSAGPDSRMTD